MSRVDRVSLVAGIVVAALGVLLLLDQAESIDLSPGIMGAAFAAALGAIFLASGLTNDAG